MRHLRETRGPQVTDGSAFCTRKGGASSHQGWFRRKASGQLTCQGPVPAALSRDLSVYKLAFVVTPVFKQKFALTW